MFTGNESRKPVVIKLLVMVASISIDDKTKKELQTIINRIVADVAGGGEPKSAEILEGLAFLLYFLGGDLTAK